MFDLILKKISEYQKIIIHRHTRPDGDCVGSQMGLKAYLKANFPGKEIYAVGDGLPEYLSRFGNEDQIADEVYDGALVIVVDTSVDTRIADARYIKGDYIIKIDHHDDSPAYGDLIYVDPTSPACSSIMVDMAKSFKDLVIPLASARAWFFGIVTDTGRFRYRGVNRKVLENTGYLLDRDIDVEDIYVNLYMKSPEALKLQGYVYENFSKTSNGVLYIHFTGDVIKQYGVTIDDAANMVNLLDSIKGSLIWVAFVDQMKPYDESRKDDLEAPHNETRVRIRSRYVPINEVGSHYRGGGHLQASGATIYSTEEKMNLLQELDELLCQYKKNNPEKY